MRSTTLPLLLLIASCKTGDAPEANEPALIAVRASGTVGVLLEDFPEALREEAAARYLAKDAAFWEQRAHRQIDLTWYKLTFRQFFYEEGAKMQLPLTREELWEVTAGAPERRTIDGHDLVVADYEFSTTIVTDSASTAISEPALATVGGTWDEPFTLPVDPLLLLQRTGYACVDEADFPPNSVDGENTWTFYDDTCGVETEETAYCHLSDFPDRSCVDAVVEEVGHVDMALSFERLEWSDSKADAVRTGVLTHDEGADLDIFEEGLENHRVTYRWFPEDSCAIAEGCVGGPGWRRILQFDAISHNVGGSALHMGDVDYYLAGHGSAGADHHLYEFSECHGHYHFSHYGSFFYGAGEDAVGGKQAFCLESTNRLSNNETTPLANDYGTCEYQGIESGWGDMYQAGLDCQWIDVTDVASPATAPLRSIANPDGLMCEGVAEFDDAGEPVWTASGVSTRGGHTIDKIACATVDGATTNNEGEVDADLPAPGEGFVTLPCTIGQDGPLRDCGYEPLTMHTCDDTLAMACTAPAGTPPFVVRACEASVALGVGTACTLADAIATDIITERGAFQVPCPAARDAVEIGSSVALYVTPVLDGQDITGVVCATAER